MGETRCRSRLYLLHKLQIECQNVSEPIEITPSPLERGQLFRCGHFTHLCNEQIRTATGAAPALLTHSRTAALELAATLCDLEAGDEVIMPSFTFVSTANAVVLRDAFQVFVDIDPNTLNIDLKRVKAAITSRTRSKIAVHYAGFPADMDALAEIARTHDLVLIEDAAPAYGSTYKGRPAGSLADMAAFSFHETKNVSSGEGAALAPLFLGTCERKATS